MNGTFLPAVIMAASLALLLGLYILHWLHTQFPNPYYRTSKRVLTALAALVLLGISMLFFTTPGLVLLHFWVISMVTEPLFRLLKKWTHKRVFLRLHVVCSALLLAALMVWGIYNINTPVQTGYVYQTEKTIRNAGYRVVLITDVHYDTVQSAGILPGYVERINALQPDLVILGGDIVEEGTSAQRMEEVFTLLGGLNSTYGTYYVYGNHDRQNYSRNPAYTPEQLRSAIEANGITVLSDEAVELGTDLVLAGREDVSWNGDADRLPTEQLLAGCNLGRVVLIADHQPVGWAENALAGADLQLSGHTHAGQIWPVGQFLDLFGSLAYGRYEKDGITVFVSSGFAGWGYPLRTSVRSEYVLLDILPK